jgi:hypothetical protein
MFCVAIKDTSGEVIEIYGPYNDTNQCMAQIDSMRDKLPDGWKFKIFNLYK